MLDVIKIKNCISHAVCFMVLVVGVEPTRSCLLRILSPVRLPFRHTSILNCRAVETKVINFVYAQDFKSSASATDHPKILKVFGDPEPPHQHIYLIVAANLSN